MELDSEQSLKLPEENDKQFRNILLQSPFAFAIFKGEDLIIEVANESMKFVLGKGQDIENKPLLEVLPELAGQTFPDYLRDVLKTGVAFTANEALCKLQRNGSLENAYFNFVYQPYWDSEGQIAGITCIAYEVTNEVTAKKRLEENAVLNSKLAAIIHSSEDAIVSKTLQGIITSWNPGAEKLFGYTEKEMIGESITRIIPPNRLNEEPEIISRIQKGEMVEHFETKRLTRDGRLVDISLSISPIRDNTGNIVGASKIARDITKIKQVNDDIRISENKYRELSISLEKMVAERTNELTVQKDFLNTIIDTAPVLIGGYDQNLRIITFNKACEELFQMKQEEVIGKTYMDIFPNAADSPGLKDLKRALNGETVKNDVFYSAATKRYFKNVISPLVDANGKVYAVIAVGLDITDIVEYTERIKLSEEKFFKLFEASPLGMSLTEIPSGKCVDVNEVHLKNVGYTREEYVGKTSLELKLVNEEDRQKIVDILNAYGSVKNYELLIRKKSGEKTPVLNSIEIVTIGDKQYYLNAIIDISDRKKSEQEIQLANIELQKMNKELESFAYVSSHDLQEPLRKIQTFANRLLEKEQENFSEKGKDYFRRIIESALRMQTLIEDLLAFSRISTSERKYELINLADVAREVAKDYKDLIKEKHAEIEIGEMCSIKAIVFQFRQIFDNMISNSLKFSNPDVPPQIKINSEIIDSTGLNMPVYSEKVCKITFTDNGIGFEPQFSDRIFEMFQRLHGKSEYPGTGIGLSIVKKVVETHNGKINAIGVPGKGSTFEIFIPV
jgi:PAS domain S-box-containing protein